MRAVKLILLLAILIASAPVVAGACLVVAILSESPVPDVISLGGDYYLNRRERHFEVLRGGDPKTIQHAGATQILDPDVTAVGFNDRFIAAEKVDRVPSDPSWAKRVYDGVYLIDKESGEMLGPLLPYEFHDKCKELGIDPPLVLHRTPNPMRMHPDYSATTWPATQPSASPIQLAPAPTRS